jgi:hypothetical protein
MDLLRRVPLAMSCLAPSGGCCRCVSPAVVYPAIAPAAAPAPATEALVGRWQGRLVSLAW